VERLQVKEIQTHRIHKVSNQKLTASVFVKNALLLDQSGDTQLAINFLRVSLTKFPNHKEVLGGLAELLEKDLQLEEARRLRFQLMNSDYKFETVFHYAQIFYLQSKDSEALSYYFEALSLLKQESIHLFELYKNIGNIHLRQGDFEGAEEYYNKAYTLNSTSDVLLVNLGTLEIQKGNHDKAELCFKSALDQNSKNDRAWVGLALIYHYKSDFDLAWANVLQALEINPKNRTAVDMIGQWAFVVKRLDELAQALENYLSMADFDLELSKLLIHCFCEMGQLHKAQLELLRAKIYFPKDRNIISLELDIKKLIDNN
jgi:tetratricopeptide (TPR) repeat protein